MLSRKDVVVESVTGSGKTLAYLAPIVHFLLALETPLKPHQVRMLIYLPNRISDPFIRKLHLKLKISGISVDRSC